LKSKVWVCFGLLVFAFGCSQKKVTLKSQWESQADDYLRSLEQASGANRAAIAEADSETYDAIVFGLVGSSRKSKLASLLGRDLHDQHRLDQEFLDQVGALAPDDRMRFLLERREAANGIRVSGDAKQKEELKSYYSEQVREQIYGK